MVRRLQSKAVWLGTRAPTPILRPQAGKAPGPLQIFKSLFDHFVAAQSGHLRNPDLDADQIQQVRVIAPAVVARQLDVAVRSGHRRSFGGSVSGRLSCEQSFDLLRQARNVHRRAVKVLTTRH